MLNIQILQPQINRREEQHHRESKRYKRQELPEKRTHVVLFSPFENRENNPQDTKDGGQDYDAERHNPKRFHHRGLKVQGGNVKQRCKG